MKKILSLIVAALLVLSMCACGAKNSGTSLGTYKGAKYTYKMIDYKKNSSSVQIPVISNDKKDNFGVLNDNIDEGAKVFMTRLTLDDGQSVYDGKCTVCSLLDGILTVGYEVKYEVKVTNTTQQIYFYDNYDISTGAWVSPADLFDLETVRDDIVNAENLTAFDSKTDSETLKNQLMYWRSIYSGDIIGQLSGTPYDNSGERVPQYTTFAYSGYEDVVLCVEAESKYGYYARFKFNRDDIKSAALDFSRKSLDESGIYNGTALLINDERTFKGTETDIVELSAKKNDYYDIDGDVRVDERIVSNLNAMLLTYTSSSSTMKAKPTVICGIDGTDSAEHASGLAVDVTTQDSDYTFFENNAARFGFITDGQHMRYVGILFARLAETYESYEACCKDIEESSSYDNIYTATFDDNAYELYYAQGTDILVPKDGEYNIEGNNLDGFYVWRQIAQ